MSEPPNDPQDPLSWMARAESSLARARIGHGVPHVVLEDLAWDAQQAAEKAIKALLVARSIPFPKTHDLSDLLNRITANGMAIPTAVDSAAKLTPYAVRARYPGGPVVTEDDYQAALAIAGDVVTWVRGELQTPDDAS